MEHKLKSTLGIIFSELFNVSLVTYLILLLLETLDKGFVSDFFNMNILLAIVLVSGVVMVSPLSEKKEADMWEMIDFRLDSLLETLKARGISENDFYFMLIVSLGGALLVFLKTQELGSLSGVLGAITAVIIFTLSYLIYTEEDTQANSKH